MPEQENDTLVDTSEPIDMGDMHDDPPEDIDAADDGYGDEPAPEDDIPDGGTEDQDAEGTGAGDEDSEPIAADEPDPIIQQIAADMGLTPEKVSALQKAGVLADVAVAFDKTLIAKGSQALAGQGQMPNQPMPPQGQMPPPPQGGLQRFQPKWQSEDGLEADPLIRGNVEGLQQYTEQIAMALAGELQQLRAQMSQMGSHLSNETLAGLYAQADPQWQEVLGSGRRVDPNSPQGKARAELQQTMAAMAAGMQQQGIPYDIHTLYERARNAVFADKLKQTVRKELSAEAEAARSQRVAPPTRRSRPMPADPRARRVEAARRAMIKAGVTD